MPSPKSHSTLSVLKSDISS